MKKTILLFFALVFGCLEAQPVFEKETVLVARVVDGDTVKLENGESVRLIGIDSTERGEECFGEAKEKLSFLVEGKIVLLERDIEERDRYKRLLGYLYINDFFVNLEMVESGNAFASEFPPNTRYSSLFSRAEEKAEQEKKGCLWGGKNVPF